MKKAIVLLSGGLDSTTCLAWAQSMGYACYALSFDYSQRHIGELEAAQQVVQQMGVDEHRIIKMDLGQLGGSALTDTQIKVPDYSGSEAIPVTYVPARNTLFLAYALAYAEVIGACDIVIGVSRIDYSNYPDCRPEFIEAFAHMANLGTKAGAEGRRFVVQTPLIDLTKAQTIQLGMALGVDYSMTVSCYQLSPEGACGVCDSCQLRIKGFKDAKVADPTSYKDAKS